MMKLTKKPVLVSVTVSVSTQSPVTPDGRAAQPEAEPDTLDTATLDTATDTVTDGVTVADHLVHATAL